MILIIFKASFVICLFAQRELIVALFCVRLAASVDPQAMPPKAENV
jgi:hypothetical protein